MAHIMRLGTAALLATLMLSSAPANGQAYPNKPIRIIVNNAPGITPDILARALAPELSKLLGQPVIVENKAGANGLIAYEYVAKQMPADGYTISLASASQLAITPWLVKELRFDPLKDLVPVIGLTRLRYVLASSTKLPAKNFNEMVAYAKANPGKLNIGSAGATTRLLTEAITRGMNLKVAAIQYRSGAAYQTALMADEVQLGLLGEGSAITVGARATMLAITGERRSRFFPNVPTLKEVGGPNIPGTTYELSVRAGTPAEIIDKLYTAGVQMLQQQELKSRLENNLQMEVAIESPASAAAQLAEQGKLFSNLAQAVGIQRE